MIVILAAFLTCVFKTRFTHTLPYCQMCHISEEIWGKYVRKVQLFYGLVNKDAY